MVAVHAHGRLEDDARGNGETETMCSGGAVIKTLAGVEFTCSSGNRLLDFALADRRLESVVTVDPCLLSSMETTRCLGNPRSQGTTYVHDNNCVNPDVFRKESRGQKWTGMNIGPNMRDHRRKRQKKRGTKMHSWATHDRWSAAEEEYIAKSKSCIGRDTMLNTCSQGRGSG